MIRAVATSPAARATVGSFQATESTNAQSGKALPGIGEMKASKAASGTRHCQSHAAWLLELIAKNPDLTLHDVQMLLLREKAVSVGIGTVWRFYDRHGIRFRKKPRLRRGPSQNSRPLDSMTVVA
jgi:transposase